MLVRTSDSLLQDPHTSPQGIDDVEPPATVMLADLHSRSAMVMKWLDVIRCHGYYDEVILFHL